MKVPISWLKEYVDFEDSVQGLADKLTFSGVEVEGIETIGGGLDDLVVGKILSVMPHPNADRLTICRVTAGGDDVQVVCGAPNVREGMHAAFAPVGAALPDGFRLKKAKIRQMDSFGMLLAEDEMGLSDDHDGIMEIDPMHAPGTPLTKVLGPPETVLDLEITPNRPDCLSLIGIAREVAALYGTQLKRPAIQLSESTEQTSNLTRIDVEDETACPRYTARILRQVQIKPSPAWMQKRLSLAGIRPINNVVDITNYVMLESGHPLHAFDQTLLKEGRIVVRHARPGETITTLDDNERKLTEEMLVIADAEKPVAVAGVMGGAGSEIRPTTTTVLLESACFDPLLTRKTSRDLALSTESSYRFERGIDAASVDWASQRAAALMVEHAGAQTAAGLIDCYPTPKPRRTILCPWSYIREITGMDIDNVGIKRLLTALELEVGTENADNDHFTAVIPSFRGDLERPVDLVEEVARLHGLDHIPTPLPKAQLAPYGEDGAIHSLSLLRRAVAGLGLREIMNYSLTAPALLDLFDPDAATRRITLPHPISADQSILRPSLIPQLVETLGRNHARQIPAALLFECGRVYWQSEQGEPAEAQHLSLGCYGPVARDPFRRREPVQPAELFGWLKGIIEALLRAQRITNWQISPVSRPYFEPGYSLSLQIGGEAAGEWGLLQAALRKEWRFAEPVAVAELKVAPLLSQVDQPIKAEAVPMYPAIARDMALIVDQSVHHADIVAIIRETAGPDLENVDLFDIFEGEAIGAGKKSMAYRITYRSDTQTLTDEQANAYHDTVKAAVKDRLDVVMREGV
jgi:phenylalanyl-tRNA synthetase beta chain